jgi:ABC-type phosphate/phosphonate transport system substrate-binding protein
MIASLPMYDFGPASAAQDRLWQLVVEELGQIGIDAPPMLTRGLPDLMPHWLSPDLLMSQTCGSPYRNRLHGKVALIGTPDYRVEGCPPGYYCSVLVARAGDPRTTLAEFDGAALAFNDPLSQSGWAAVQTDAAALGITLLPGLQTGAHRASVKAVADGKADLASIDAVTWRLLRPLDADAQRLKVIGQTTPTPGLPLITAQDTAPEPLFDAISAAIARLTAADRDTLGLHGLIRILPDAYLAVPNPRSPAQFAQSA